MLRVRTWQQLSHQSESTSGDRKQGTGHIGLDVVPRYVSVPPLQCTGDKLAFSFPPSHR